MKPIISGIQQIGLGNTDVYATFDFYRKNLGMDIPVFDEAAEAALMLPYTGGKPRSRHAILAINMQGGGGLEEWQYTSRTAMPPKQEILQGDYGIYIAKYKAKKVKPAFDLLKNKGVTLLGEIKENPAGKLHFYFKDLWGNIGEVIEANDWFTHRKEVTGGIYGATIGVSDMDESMSFYASILGYDRVLSDRTDTFEDFQLLPGGQQVFRRVILTHSEERKGPFSQLLGRSEIELVELQDSASAKPIFEGRFWGDMGYIHLCFDIVGMDEMRNKCENLGHPFTVDSAESFDMGEAAGHFVYIEDPDGTLIEFVETHKLPILKKVGWYLHLKNRNPVKPLPKWMLKTMGWGRVK